MVVCAPWARRAYVSPSTLLCRSEHDRTTAACRHAGGACGAPSHLAQSMCWQYVYISTISLLSPAFRGAGTPVSACFPITLCLLLTYRSAEPHDVQPVWESPRSIHRTHRHLCEGPFAACGVEAAGLYLPLASCYPGLFHGCGMVSYGSLLTPLFLRWHFTDSWGPVSHMSPCQLHTSGQL